MVRIAICDDDEKYLEIIKNAVKNYESQHSEKYEVYLFDNALTFLESLEKSGGFDVALLDICMPGFLGTDIAHEIRNRKDNTEIIFITTSEEFAVEAFSLKAAHYIVKPFTQEKFDEAMDRAKEKIKNEQPKPFKLKLSGGRSKSIDAKDVIYIESRGHAQNVYLKDGICEDTRQTLGEMSSLLEVALPEQFVSPYKGYLVNLSWVQTVETDRIILRQGDSLPVAKGSFRRLRETYMDFMFRKRG